MRVLRLLSQMVVSRVTAAESWALQNEGLGAAGFTRAGKCARAAGGASYTHPRKSSADLGVTGLG